MLSFAVVGSLSPSKVLVLAMQKRLLVAGRSLSSVQMDSVCGVYRLAFMNG